MSIERVVKDINLVGQQIFDHTPVVKKENQRILDSFERNERYKEFEGLIRASHALVEATDASLESLLTGDELKRLNDELQNVSQAVTQLSVPLYKKEHDDYIDDVRQKQAEKVSVVAAEVQKQLKNLREEHSQGRTAESMSSVDTSAASEVDLT